MWYESSNPIYGRTKNPYNPMRIAGGSSGGEGSILGSGASVIGVGADVGGSIRLPSFFNGIFGHKPTALLVSNTGQYPNAEGEAVRMLSTGPMARYSTDLWPRLWQKTLSRVSLPITTLSEKNIILSTTKDILPSVFPPLLLFCLLIR